MYEGDEADVAGNADNTTNQAPAKDEEDDTSNKATIDTDEDLAKNPGDELTPPAPAPEEEDTEDDVADNTVPTAVHESPIKNPEGDLALLPAPWPEEEEVADYTADTATTFIDMMDQIAPAAAAVARPDKIKLKFKKGIPVKFKEDCAVCSVCGIM